MKEYNYTVSIEAPSKEIADMLIDHICKENYDILEMKQKAEEKNETQSEQEQSRKDSDDLVRKMEAIQTFIQIFTHCLKDETAIGRIASLFGITNPQTANQ